MNRSDPTSREFRSAPTAPGSRGTSVLLLALLACGAPAGGVSGVAPEAGIAILQEANDSGVHGVVHFEPAASGVRVVTEVAGLPAGRHAYHVHLYGDCSAKDATSAGTHFNFVGSSTDPPDDIERITGNLGELVSEGAEPVRHQALVELASLAGPKSIIGRAVVVHARGNDPDSPPIGDAGARIACGVIGIDAPPGNGSD